MSGARRMGLGALADVIAPERVSGLPVGEVTALAYDSRKVIPGTLFFAVPGDHVDGHDFVGSAVDAGAIGAVVEHEVPGVAVPQLVVDRSRRALADAAFEWFGRPADDPRMRKVIGVTGTDGKSTVTALTADMLWAIGWHPGQIGTVSIGIFDDVEPNTARTTTPEALELQALLARMVEAGNDSVVLEATSHGLALERTRNCHFDDAEPNVARTTTPEALELQALLARMVEAGNDSVVLEATSHGLALERTRNCHFDVGVVTTVTSEHLEFHRTIENYRAAKARLVEEAPIAILNADDGAFGYFRDRARERVITYAIDTEADLRAGALRPDDTGTTFHVESPRWHGDVRVPLPGRFNVHNALAALGVADALELPLERAADAIGSSRGVPGRMERIDAGQPFSVIVDYAHTTDALRKVLEILRPITRGRLIAVFGSAGERDPTKRGPMGRVAAESADLVIVTDEDPRLEDPRAINEQIADGARSAGAVDGEGLWVIDDRREAIAHAIGLAREGDTVLLAGKGHEASMFYGTEKRPWDDRAAARDALRAAGWQST